MHSGLPFDVMASSIEPLGNIDPEPAVVFIDQDRIYLLGHSLGGMTAMGLASARPGLIDGVVPREVRPFPNRANSSSTRLRR